MVSVDLQSLVRGLNPSCRKALEAAVGLTLSRTHYNAEIEHWLLKLVESPGGDIPLILRQYEVNVARLTADLTRVLDKLKTGNSRPPALSPDIITLVREAWLIASLRYGVAQIRSGHLLAALLSNESLAPRARESSAELGRIPAETLLKDLQKIVASSSEAAEAPALGGGGAGGEAGPAAVRPAGSGALDQFTIDLTAQAKAGKIDTIVGRDPEVRQIVDILLRRRQNNPILTGEAGVGKTAVVEGFALRIAQGDVPDALKGVVIRTLDLGLLQAGAGMKGEFENRLKSVIDEIKASPVPIITFIDEAHTLIGAGGAAGQNDAANLLKPALARGEMRTIAATTWAEYKKYFERDPALTRRFQVVKVEEPEEPIAIAMMRGLVPVLEKHHKVRILSDAVKDSVRLSHRYIPARQLPDKSVSLLDTACARVAMSQGAIPAPIEDCRRQIESLTAEIGIAQREAKTRGAEAELIAELEVKKAAAEKELVALEARWNEEKAMVKQLGELRAKLEDEKEPAGADVRTEYEALVKKLRTLQGEAPLVKDSVDGQAIADVVAAWTGIPVGRMMGDEIRNVLGLKERMKQRIIGQDHAIDTISEAMWTARAKLTDPRKPIGVFMLAGTSGVGKTETALALADQLYGGEQNMTTIAMSEFKEEHKVSMLVGSPPGYVGYGEGGVLTEAVRRRPYSVILLDEVEKAHPGVQDVFFQVFDKGSLRDGEGRDIDFKNTVIILTSNAGTETIAKLAADPDTMPDPKGLTEAIRPELLKFFKPAFLGRIVVIPYLPLSDDVLKRIIEINMGRIRSRLREHYKAEFDYDPALVANIAERCKENESGARNVETIVSRTLLPELSARLLGRMADGQPVSKVRVSPGADGGFAYEIN
ncbi:MAG: type VI secretion system ATPase TssH [Alphaproteobacteria bacterium]|nr:type VI secretion system ATPase TssH [Alphaproteobacteria bacterium]